VLYSSEMSGYWDSRGSISFTRTRNSVTLYVRRSLFCLLFVCVCVWNIVTMRVYTRAQFKITVFSADDVANMV